MKRITIARGAGDPAQLQTPGLPVLTAWDEAAARPAPGSDGPSPRAAETAPAAAPSADGRRSRLGTLLGLLAVVALVAGGAWVWKNPDAVGLGEVLAAPATDEADASGEASPPPAAGGESASDDAPE